MPLILKAFIIFMPFISLCVHGSQQILFDEARQRQIPITVTYPQMADCTETTPCNLAVLSSGYGVPHTGYQFIADELLKNNYAVLTVQHQLNDDPQLSITPPFLKTRAENWQRGTDNLTFALDTLAPKHPTIDFNKVALVGHSNGGDIGAWFIKHHPQKVSMLITLDHRRVPLPRLTTVKVLSIRGSDFPADKHVLYTADELSRLNACVVTIAKSRHNDMTDYGPAWLKTAIVEKIDQFLNQAQCE